MSENKRIIAIDAMGGDRGPAVALGGMNQFLYQHGESDVHFHLIAAEFLRQE